MKQQVSSDSAPSGRLKKDPGCFREKLASFFRTGLLIVSASLLLTIGLKQVPGLLPTGAPSHKELPVYCVDTEKTQVSITFNVTGAGGGTADSAGLTALLSLLDQCQVKASFFLTGEWIRSNPDQAKAIASAGHDLGICGETDTDMTRLTKKQCKNMLSSLRSEVKELTGVEMILFRPPHGSYNDTVLQAAREADYQSILWDVDTLDWKDYGAASIVSTALEHTHLGSGSILLLHSGAKNTTEALPALIDGLQRQGYALVPVSELIYQNNYSMDQEGRQHQNR